MTKITILGGDQRNLFLANLLSKDNHEVTIYGFNEIPKDFKLIKEENLSQAIKNSDIIISPLPFTREEGILNMPNYDKRIEVEEVFENLSENHIFIAGKIEEKYKKLASDYSLKLVDYFEREEMQVLNGIPTAEGAIQVAMEEMDITLCGSNALVLGFGRIGKILSKMLYGIGANTHVGARKYSDLSWIKTYGYNPINIKEIKDHISKMDVIFNTIPKLILDESILRNVDKNSLIIDLASKPGGVDFKKAEEMNIKTIWALALPGKVAPTTAAQCIKDTIYNIIEELEV